MGEFDSSISLQSVGVGPEPIREIYSTASRESLPREFLARYQLSDFAFKIELMGILSGGLGSVGTHRVVLH